MMESLKTRLEFPSPVIQAQTVRSLVAAVLKEKGSDGQITWSCAQGPALEALWQQCCSDCAVVCSACCDTLVLLVDQGHADLDYILSGVLNLLPSARYATRSYWTPRSCLRKLSCLSMSLTEAL
ncbi:focadhesin-like [Haplochromis burtoni]|uniref:focadhesin-like n=1 Tax=Haplochromis burtoni TaxID=8153 RepID=UPI001C2D7943|nr:focadhesin-like [Haplochromis burtoni]